MADKTKKSEPAPVAEPVPEPRIVSGSAQFSGHGGIATAPLAATIEAAMSTAVLLALKDGVSIEDSKTILEYKMAARRAVLAARG